MNLENIVKQASKKLKNCKINSHYLDSEIILSNIMQVQREYLIINKEINVSKKIEKKFKKAIRRRLKKEPVAYITGKKEFWSQDFLVNESTLVPRPETELLIYKVIKYFKGKRINILDIGTGTGCILLSILNEIIHARGTGIDISPKAIKTAIMNSSKFNLMNRAKFKVCDINKFYSEKFDLIVSNPPYIPLREIKNLSKDIVNHEPIIALNGGIDGLDLIKKVIYKSKDLLKIKGLLAIEIGNQQYLKVSSLLGQHGFKEVSKEYDCNRNVRCIISTKL